MHKKHIFLRVFQKITIFACVFCAVPAWSETTCDIDFTPVTGNSWQNGTPTPTSPVEIESIGTKVGNKYAVQVAVNYDGGVVDLGTLNWVQGSVAGRFYTDSLSNLIISNATSLTTQPLYCSLYRMEYINENMVGYLANKRVVINDISYTDVTAFKQAMSGVMLYYQRATDETWTAPTLKTVYLDEPLRKVGDYADVLDYKNGTITRNVGVKVFDGTEDWTWDSSYRRTKVLFNECKPTPDTQRVLLFYCSHYINLHNSERIGAVNPGEVYTATGGSTTNLWIHPYETSVTDFKSWLAQQYANGTPVTVYYPLETPVVEQIENWSCTPPITDIQIATTKMVDDEFAQAEANLAATVQTIESVVSRTIAQTGQIQVLQDTKQTRPDENCPANMKCLLVQDEDGTPHWYPIIEP